MKFLTYLLVCVLALVSGTGCTVAPRFVHHPAPTTTLNLTAFTDVGCTTEAYGEIACQNNDEISRLCNKLYRPHDVLGALSPPVPIAMCQIYLYQPTDTDIIERPDDFLFRDGGLIPVAIRYVVLEDEHVTLIATEAELRHTFAPIESAEEALGYAVAATNLRPQFDITYDSTYHYEVSTIEDTHVEKTPTGWRINLFDYQVFGCGPHYSQGFVVDVSDTGEITLGKATNLYRDPGEDQLCVD